MDPFNEATSENKESNKISSKFNIGDEIKSNYILKNIFTYIHQKRKLETIKINKKLQKKINLGIDDYKECCSKYSSIIIEITPLQNKSGKFINIANKEEEQYYHIYFDDVKEEIKRYYLIENEKVSKIKKDIIIHKFINILNLFNFYIIKWILLIARLKKIKNKIK